MAFEKGGPIRQDTDASLEARAERARSSVPERGSETADTDRSTAEARQRINEVRQTRGKLEQEIANTPAEITRAGGEQVDPAWLKAQMEELHAESRGLWGKLGKKMREIGKKLSGLVKPATDAEFRARLEREDTAMKERLKKEQMSPDDKFKARLEAEDRAMKARLKKELVTEEEKFQARLEAEDKAMKERLAKQPASTLEAKFQKRIEEEDRKMRERLAKERRKRGETIPEPAEQTVDETLNDFIDSVNSTFTAEEERFFTTMHPHGYDKEGRPVEAPLGDLELTPEEWKAIREEEQPKDTRTIQEKFADRMAYEDAEQTLRLQKQPEAEALTPEVKFQARLEREEMKQQTRLAQERTRQEQKQSRPTVSPEERRKFREEYEEAEAEIAEADRAFKASLTPAERTATKGVVGRLFERLRGKSETAAQQPEAKRMQRLKESYQKLSKDERKIMADLARSNERSRPKRLQELVDARQVSKALQEHLQNLGWKIPKPRRGIQPTEQIRKAA